jgi:hypothetical protein
MIRRTGTAALSSLSKQFRKSNHQPMLSLLRQQEQSQSVLSFQHQFWSPTLQKNLLSTEANAKDESEVEEGQGASTEGGRPVLKEIRDPEKDRTKIIPVETSIRYLQSDG